MVPRIARRGHSFKGAGMYYLHDKEADTRDRVAWTYTHNIPTQDPDKAFNWMIHTAMNAERLKHQAGVPTTGRKSKAGAVYSFSLAWHPEQEPTKETMQEAALRTLGLLNLSEHEAIFVAHKDTEHPHVHVIANLVHPENGKTAVLSYDRLIMSAWAEQVERDDGEILCEQRVINNERRRRSPKRNRQFELVKHREQKLIDAKRIEELYNRSDSGKAFQAALTQEGYTLAKGDRRGFVLVDTAGKIYSLSRQLKGQRAFEINTRLKDVDELQKASDLAMTRKYYSKMQSRHSSQGKVKNPAEHYDETHLEKLDELRAWEQKSDRLRTQLKQQQELTYGRKNLSDQIKKLEEDLDANKRNKLFSSMKAKEQELTNLKKNLSSIDGRIAEQNSALELRILKDKPKEQGYTQNKNVPPNDNRNRKPKSRDSDPDMNHDR